MNKNSVYILGNFGYVTGHLDGQTMESRSLLQLLTMNGVTDVDYFDTEELHHNKKSVFTLFSKLFKTKTLFYLGAQGSLKYLFPILWAICKLSRIDFHYFVVGGWIAEFLKPMPLHRFMLRRIKYMYCETKSIAQKLKDWYSFDHAVWFPNFRIYDFEPEITYHEDTLRLVFMSRIVKHKGYHRVFDLARHLEQSGIQDVVIDFYGPLYDSDQEAFFEGVSQFDFVTYKGVLQPTDINATLATYDAMLFPTSYPGEGLPGTILDSYISGIPVIASDWRYNSELIDHGESGFIYDLQKPDEFYEAVLTLYNNRKQLCNMKRHAHLKSKAFNADTVWEIINKRVAINPSTS